MPSPESKNVIAMLRAQPTIDPTSNDPAALRASFDQMTSLLPVAGDATVEATVAGGVPAEWVSTPGADARRAVLYIHGGGWVLGSPKTHRALTAEISRATGARVLAIDYRLAPEHVYPAALDDCVAAYQSLLDGGIAPGNIAIAGDSAGGSLTGCTLLALKSRGITLPGCAVMLSPSTDMAMTGASWRTRSSIDPMLGGSADAADGPMQWYLAGTDAKTPTASPLYGDLHGLPPILLHCGTEEVLFDDTVRFDAAARAAGVDTSVRYWNGQVHVFQMFAAMLPEGREAIEEIGTFVRAHTGGGGSRGVSEGIGQLVTQLRSRPVVEGATVAEQRAGFEMMAQPVAADVVCTPVSAGGVPAEWIAAPGADAARTILYLHGGGYVLGSIATHREMCGRISRAAGARVLTVDYRMAPEHPHPAAVDDAVAAYDWLLAQGADPASVVIAGDSAGGGLTAATLVALRDEGRPAPAAGVLISPWTDLAISGESITTRATLDPMITSGTGVGNMASLYLNGVNAKTPLASPLYADLRGLPPLLIQVGTSEVLFDDASRFDAAARTAGVDVTFEAWNGMVHVWHLFAGLVPEGQEAIERIGAFVRERAKTPAAV